MRWTRAVAAVSLALTLHASAPALAQVVGPSGPVGAHFQPPPAPGTHRLIRIGPQALVMEDDHGRVTMVDEPEPQPRRVRSAIALTAALGVLGVGTFLWLQGTEPGLQLEVGGPR